MRLPEGIFYGGDSSLYRLSVILVTHGQCIQYRNFALMTKDVNKVETFANRRENRSFPFMHQRHNPLQPNLDKRYLHWGFQQVIKAKSTARTPCIQGRDLSI